jgi:methylamine methyltransferase corrinoid protein reductive activase
VLQQGQCSALGITGTGVIALIHEGMEAGLIQLPGINIPGGEFKLAEDMSFDKTDLSEAGKAIGALRAGYLTLAKEAGIKVEDITCAYMAGASGTYVDAYKAYRIGMTPPGVQKIYQIGNTSLTMAKELVINPDKLAELQDLALRLRAKHCMFGMSKDFANAYLLELSYWDEGMPKSTYNQLGRSFKLLHLPEPEGRPNITKLAERDIADVGTHGIKIIEQVGNEVIASLDGCVGCGACVAECPEKALELLADDMSWSLKLRPDRCNGTACLRCERKCPERVCSIKGLFAGVTAVV